MNRRHALFSILLVVLLLLVIEGLGFATIRFLQGRSVVFREPIEHSHHVQRTYDEYLAQRDPVLGWPFPDQFGGDHFDASGSRRVPAFEDPFAGEPCLSLYGDSFTMGGEVDHEHAWGNLLSKKLDCRVANFGVGGYGSDQALLRFRLNESDTAEFVILGHLSENIVRNLTRNRDLLSSELQYGFKPRFVLDASGELELVPIPRPTEHEYRRMVGLAAPMLIAEHESLQPGGAAGAIRSGFPWSLSILRNLGDYRMRAVLTRTPRHTIFYERDHELEGLQITAKILETFSREAREKGRLPLVLLMATEPDLRLVRRSGQWSYATLTEELSKRGVDYIDFGPRLLEYANGRNLKELFKPFGHYNEEGNEVLARFVCEHLLQRGWSRPGDAIADE